MIQQHLDRLDQRARYLTKRIAAKEEMAWESEHDRAERDALVWALGQLRPHHAVEAPYTSDYDARGPEFRGGE